MAHEQQAWGAAICPLIPPTGGTLLISPLVTAALPKVPLLAAIAVGAPLPTTAGGSIPVAQRERVANENVPPPSSAEHQDSSEPIDTQALREEYKAIIDDLLRAAPDLAGRERPKCKGVRIAPGRGWFADTPALGRRGGAGKRILGTKFATSQGINTNHH